mgnify:CR=1 FL=1
MQCEIITIGDELLIGQVVDTNSAWMATELNACGIEVKQISSVHDDAQHIIAALDEAFERADIVLTTGGLGPTKDDITKHVLCDYFQTELIPDNTVKTHIEALYKDRPEVLNRLTETQWLVPKAATILPNRVGSAPLMVFHKGDKILASMPGVPYEMKIAMTEQVLPYLSAHSAVFQRSGLSGAAGLNSIIHKTALVYGVPESTLALRLEEWENNLPKDLHLAYLPKDGIVRLRLSQYSDNLSAEGGLSAQRSDSEAVFKQMLELLGDDCIATEDKPLESILGDLLKARHATIATAESCTGGKLASLLNKQPGSSAFYYGSVIAYDNSVKHNVLGVKQEDLDTLGAVSEQVVKQMATGVRQLLKTDYAIATSGIAGPDGGTAEKPVGTVWIAWATPTGTFAQCFHLGRLREQITDRACVTSLTKLIKYLHIS